jgi:DNA-binding IscR family transcriptional regulator
MTDAPGLDLDAGLWLSISEIARQKNKSRQAVAKRVDSLVEAGLLETKPGEGGTKLVNLAQYDRAVGDTGDAFKEAGAETKAEAESETASPALRDHQSRAAQYTADLKFLDLEERLGRLVPVAEVAEAAEKCAEATVRIIDRLPTFADAIAAAVGKDGPGGARSQLKEIARGLRQEIAVAMGKLAGQAEPMTIEPAESDDAG